MALSLVWLMVVFGPDWLMFALPPTNLSALWPRYAEMSLKNKTCAEKQHNELFDIKHANIRRLLNFLKIHSRLKDKAGSIIIGIALDLLQRLAHIGAEIEIRQPVIANMAP